MGFFAATLSKPKDLTLKPGWGYLHLQRRHGLLALLAVGLAVVLPEKQDLPKLCLFHRATGSPCPFCGLSRSFQATGHGHFRAATRHHLLGLPSFALFAGLGALLLTVKPEIKIRLTTRRVFTVVAVILVAWLLKLSYHRF